MPGPTTSFPPPCDVESSYRVRPDCIGTLLAVSNRISPRLDHILASGVASSERSCCRQAPLHAAVGKLVSPETQQRRDAQ